VIFVEENLILKLMLFFTRADENENIGSVVASS